MRQPWRGHRATQQDPEAEDDDPQAMTAFSVSGSAPTKKQKKKLDELMRNLELGVALSGNDEPRHLAARLGDSVITACYKYDLLLHSRARAAAVRLSGIARRAGGVAECAARRARGLPWPAAAVLWRSAAFADDVAERLSPSPPGLEAAEYLSASLRSLAAKPRRSAVREAAASYANDLAQALPESSPLRIEALKLGGALGESHEERANEEADMIDVHASNLRPGSSARVSMERAAENLRSRVFWKGGWLQASDASAQLRQAADFWDSYSRRDR